MTFSSVRWALVPSTLPWETTTAITSSHRLVVGAFKPLLSHDRSQDPPHSLGGELARQFSWSALIMLYDTSFRSKGALQEL